MTLIKVFRSLGPIDLRNIRRDDLLRWMILVPLFFTLVVRWGLPPLQKWLSTEYSFDLMPYYPLLASFTAIFTPALFGMVIGFLLLDERDDGTLIALQVTPLAMASYTTYRIAMPVALSVFYTVLIFPLTLLNTLGYADLILVSLAAAPMAPAFALFLASFSKNKVQGFALMKGSGFLFFGPLLAFFVEEPLQFLFGLIPTYWSIKLYIEMNAGGDRAVIFFAIGLIYFALLIWVLMKRFNKMLHQ